MQVECGIANLGMAEQYLDGAQVSTGFKHVRREAVSKQMRRKTHLLIPARLPAPFTAFHTTFGVMGTSARKFFTVPGKR
jgi:hypothetical protein